MLFEILNEAMGDYPRSSSIEPKEQESNLSGELCLGCDIDGNQVTQNGQNQNRGNWKDDERYDTCYRVFAKQDGHADNKLNNSGSR